MKNFTGLIIYDCGSKKNISVTTLARAASIARVKNEQVDLVKNGIIVGLKEAGNHRINWI